jgi:hypothetical protein
MTRNRAKWFAIAPSKIKPCPLFRDARAYCDRPRRTRVEMNAMRGEENIEPHIRRALASA